MLNGGAPLIKVSFYRIYNKFWDFDNWVFHRGCALNRWRLGAIGLCSLLFVSQ